MSTSDHRFNSASTRFLQNDFGQVGAGVADVSSELCSIFFFFALGLFLVVVEKISPFLSTRLLSLTTCFIQRTEIFGSVDRCGKRGRLLGFVYNRT